jgi:hypothetical protein
LTDDIDRSLNALGRSAGGIGSLIAAFPCDQRRDIHNCGGHDEQCEADFIAGPMLWTACDCLERERLQRIRASTTKAPTP